MRLIPILCLIIFLESIASCTKKEESLMHVVGHVKGLKKGKLYLQKEHDTILITIDSLQIDGNSDFIFSQPLKNPEIFYLYLDKNDGNPDNDRIRFFGEQGTVTIHTTRDFFEAEARISGSITHKKLEEYQRTAAKFNTIALDLIKAEFEAHKNNDNQRVAAIRERSEKNRKMRYRYTLNFALNNKDSYIAPYIVLSEVGVTRLKYLDTLYRSLPREVAHSKYGKALNTLIISAKNQYQK